MNEKLRSLIDAANEQNKNLEEQILLNEKQLLSSYFTGEYLNPHDLFIGILSTITDSEQKIIKIGLDVDPERFGYRRLYEDIGVLAGVNRVTASKRFKKAIKKCAHPSRSRNLNRLIENCEKLVDLGGVKKERVDIYLRENFFMEFNFIHFVKGYQRYLIYD